MNFCKDNDKYISLYIDELLDEKSKIEFLEHTKECSECAVKFEETTYFAQLCREEQAIQLPEDFSSSLHKRLLEMGIKDNKNKFGFFVYNKKFIASLSTAAILAISLLAYNLLPQMGSKTESASMADEAIRTEASSAAAAYSGSIDDKSIAALGGATDNSIEQDEGTTSDSTANSVITFSEEAIGDTAVKFNKALPETGRKTSEAAALQSSENKSDTSSSSTESLKQNEVNDDEVTTIYGLRFEDTNDPNNMQYFSNYAELNLKVSPKGIEIETLKKFMKELGAIEPKSATISSIVGNLAESKVADTTETLNKTELEAPVESLDYLNYYLPISLYSTLKSQATKYELELSIKNDIIKNSITNIYNELNTQKIEIDRKVKEALIKNEDVSIYETEKTRITEEMNKIIAEKEMVTVRIFFDNK